MLFSRMEEMANLKHLGTRSEGFRHRADMHMHAGSYAPHEAIALLV